VNSDKNSGRRRLLDFNSWFVTCLVSCRAPENCGGTNQYGFIVHISAQPSTPSSLSTSPLQSFLFPEPALGDAHRFQQLLQTRRRTLQSNCAHITHVPSHSPSGSSCSMCWPVRLLRRRQRDRKSPQRILRLCHSCPLRMPHMSRQPSLVNLPLPELRLRFWSFVQFVFPYFGPCSSCFYTSNFAPALSFYSSLFRCQKAQPFCCFRPYPASCTSGFPLAWVNGWRIIIFHFPRRSPLQPLRHPLDIVTRSPPSHIAWDLLESPCRSAAL